MFLPPPHYRIASDQRDSPRIMVVVDTEEEFSWDSFSSTAVAVTNIAEQHRAQSILTRFGIKPVYAIDYPVAAQEAGYRPLKEWCDDGLCEIGAQLHTWVTPPIEEDICVRNTFQCNLPAALERAKIVALTEKIRENVGVAPRLFKAGRHGFGRRTTATLIAQGYTVDNSVLPYADLAPYGPDYSGSPLQPFWLDTERRLLEVPTSAGLVGLLQDVNEFAALSLLGRTAVTLKVPAVLARLGLLERIRLTPEGIELHEAKRLTMDLLQRGQRLFVLCYHSSSLLPGGTPYVRTAADRDRLLRWIEEYLTFFFGPLGGHPISAADVLAYAHGQSAISHPSAPSPARAS